MNVILPPELRHVPRRDPAFKRYIKVAADIRGQVTKPYDVGTAWERARRKHDPLLAPHGMLRGLRPGDNLHAVEFLETFGPLVTRETPSSYREHGVNVRIDLSQFWTLQEHFRRFVSLHELRNSPTELLLAIRTIFKHRPLYGSVREIGEWFMFLGQLAKRPVNLEPLYRRFANVKTMGEIKATLMAEDEETPPDVGQITRPIPGPGRGLSDINTEPLPDLDEMLPSKAEHLPEIAMWLLSCELNHVLAAKQARWVAEGEALCLRFAPPTSLWEMVWQLFAADTVGVFWRVCPHCQRLFYPPRADRYYCTSRQQVLASKREWAKRSRASKDQPQPSERSTRNERLQKR